MAHSSWEEESNDLGQIHEWTIGQLDDSTNTQLARRGGTPQFAVDRCKRVRGDK